MIRDRVNDKTYMLPPGAVKLPKGSIFRQKLEQISSGLMAALDFGALADFYREKRNQFAAGEFWGKIMRAAALLWCSTKEDWLMEKMRAAVSDMLALQGPDGEISTAPKADQPNGSSGADLWERKYVMLGLLEYYRVTEDEKVKEALIKLLDYTLAQVGDGPGKMPLLKTGWAFGGIESSSILEPVVKIYRLSGDPRHLAFAKYIVDAGGCIRENIFRAGLEGKSPYMIGWDGDPHTTVAKAYEMMSCYEGLIEYYRVTGDEDAGTAALRFWDKLAEEEITELGSGGADKPFNLGPGTGEQWNRTRLEQANPDIDLMMETCVTVTWMKLCYQLLRLTGDSRYADQIEKSSLNALTAALKPDGMFFEYFPRFNGTRNPKVNFSYNIGGYDLSCCTANGPMGLSLYPYAAFMNTPSGPAVNFYTDALVNYGKLSLNIQTEFPETGRTFIEIRGGAYFTCRLLLRIPDYSEDFTLRLNGEPYSFATDPDYPGYAVMEGPFAEGMIIQVDFRIRDFRVISAGSVNPRGNGKVLLKHGPLVLARDARAADTESPVRGEGGFTLEPADPPSWAWIARRYDGQLFVDYQSAGGTWDGASRFTSWAEGCV